MNSRRHGHPRRGVSLIEAIVALAVMAFGMVAIVGLQATLRNNADGSKQRAEAVRIAQEEIERWRSFVGLQADPGGVDYGDIAGTTTTTVAGLNATYTVVRTVPPQQAPAPKTVSIQVSWSDRTSQQGQEDPSVVLNSAIAGISPELAGALSLPQNRGSTWRVNNRNPAVPRSAKNFGDGSSGFVPPQSAGPKVVWVFNNATGIIERTCRVEADVSNDTLSAESVAADLASCDSSRTAQLLSGFVRFANLLVQPDEHEAEAPSGLPLNLELVLSLTSENHPDPGYACFDDSPELALATAQPVIYYCAIYSNPARTWSGRLRVVPLAFTAAGAEPWVIGVEAAERKVCRYTTLSDDGTQTSRNSAHPLDYSVTGSAAGAALREQNFLVIRGSHACPTDATSDADPVNANTRVHQNGVLPYT